VAENALQVEVRTAGGKGVARKLRAKGRIPAVCYGKAQDPVGLELDPSALRKLLAASDAGMNTIISLQGGGSLDGTQVLVKELQRDPVRGAYLHADFYTVDLTQRVEVSVPVNITGRALGVEAGGVLDQVLREIELSCLPVVSVVAAMKEEEEVVAEEAEEGAEGDAAAAGEAKKAEGDGADEKKGDD
jgi:large subunit ribosomal protein L25